MEGFEAANIIAAPAVECVVKRLDASTDLRRELDLRADTPDEAGAIGALACDDAGTEAVAARTTFAAGPAVTRVRRCRR